MLLFVLTLAGGIFFVRDEGVFDACFPKGSMNTTAAPQRGFVIENSKVTFFLIILRALDTLDRGKGLLGDSYLLLVHLEHHLRRFAIISDSSASPEQGGYDKLPYDSHTANIQQFFLPQLL